MTNFTDSINITAALLQEIEDGSVGLSEARSKVSQLLTSVDTARGFFVSMLTGENDIAEHPAQWLLDSFSSNEDVVSELLAKNLVMSTATKLMHERAANVKDAEGSARVAKRVHVLIDSWNNPRLKTELLAMIASINKCLGDNDGDTAERYVDFLSRWSYDREQLLTAKAALEQRER